MSFDKVLDLAVRYSTFKGILLGTGIVYAVYGILTFIYRITLHPLARFPGPTLAGATYWYEFYYDLYPHKLRYLWKIEEMHKKYGPIVRINPMHLHINDPDYLDEIYAGGKRKRNRDPWFYRSELNGPLGWSVFQSVDHDVHRMRRAALNPFFSMRSIQELESMIVDKIQVFCSRFADACKTGQAVSLTHACGALTMDVISSYAFGTETKNLLEEDFNAEGLEAYNKLSQFSPIGRQFPWIAKACLTMVPPSIMHRISPAAALIPKNRAFFRDLIRDAIAEQKDADEIADSKGLSKSEKREKKKKTIFQDIVQSKLPPSEKEPARLAAEANLLLIAGTETTAKALSLILFHILDNEPVLQRIREELSPLLPLPSSRVPLAVLCASPYFVSPLHIQRKSES